MPTQTGFPGPARPARLTLVVSAIATILLSSTTPAAAQSITEYAIPTPGSSPRVITAGPDGNMWFTESDGNRIGKITPAGAITEYAVPTSGSLPGGITAGPDGNLWFTECNGNKIGKITTAGSFTEYSIPTVSACPAGITAGPDGNMWFTESSGNKIGKITPAGTITEYAVPTPGSSPQGITAGPDGNIWFTESSGNKIGKITTAGSFTEYSMPTANAYPAGITAGPDGKLWFTKLIGVGNVTTAGSFTEYTLPSFLTYSAHIAVGSDGNLWLTETLPSRIARVTPAGVITEYVIPDRLSSPRGIAAGADGNIWFTEDGDNEIAWINPLSPPVAAPLPLERFTCYKTVPSSGSVEFPGATGVSLVDEFGASTVALIKPRFFCQPTFFDFPYLVNDTEHLEAYQLKAAKTVLPVVDVEDHFGTLSLALKGRSHLLVPGVSSFMASPGLPPGGFNLDHFQCYKVSIAKGTPKFVPWYSVSLEDPFASMDFDVTKPKHLCSPVNKDGQSPDAAAHAEHLVCYQAKPRDKYTGVNLFVNNPLGPEKLEVKTPALLCMPALVKP